MLPDSPFIKYVNEDKTQYPYACDTINPSSKHTYIDEDKDFLIGNSGGFLMNMNFKFIDTHVFSAVAIQYEKNKKDPNIISLVESLPEVKTENRNKYYYCPHLNDSNNIIEKNLYDKFWRRETYRRRNGMTAKCKLLNGEIVNLHITGAHYNYLNYSRLNRTATEEELKVLHSQGDYNTKLISGFPRFWDGDYWNFKIDHFIARNSFHLTKAKARSKGYSFKRGSQAANTINLVKNVVVILAADIIDYLTDKDATSSMVKINLDWLEDNTHWRRGYVSENLENLQIGFKTKSGGNKSYGYLGKLISVSIGMNESAAIGKRALEIDFEEAGKSKNLLKALGVTLSSTEVGAGNVGTIRVYGTAGTKEANWRDFAYCFYNPSANKMMAFENVWDNNARHSHCGFFHPQILNLEPFMDKDGNSLLQEAYEYDYYDKLNAAKSKSVADYLVYVAQRANSPEEAFKSVTENLFSCPELDNHITNIRYNPEKSYYRDGIIVETDKGKTKFVTNDELLHNDKTVHGYIDKVPFDAKDDLYGCIREYYPPFSVDGIIPDNLYAIVYDTVGKDKDSDTIIDKNSLNSIQVWMLPNSIANSSGDILVAAYAGRPPRMQQADRIALQMAKHYNAKILVEVDRGETVNNFRRWSSLDRLYKDPTKVNTNPEHDDKNDGIGINMGGGNKADNATESFAELIMDPVSKREDGSDIYLFNHIQDVPLLLEMQSFKKGQNFDRLSAARLYPIVRLYMEVKKKKARSKTNKKSIHDVLGLYGYNSNNYELW